MLLGVGKVIGQVGVKGWAQVHDFTPEFGEKLEKRGRLIAVVSLPDGLEAGREAIARVHELYYGQLEADPLTQLRQVLSTIHAEDSRAEIICLVQIGEVIYVACVGGGVWLKRKDREGWVVTTTDSTIRVLTTTITQNQSIVLGNLAFWDCIPLGVVRSAVENSNLDSGIETLLSVVYGNSRGEGAAGAIVNFTIPQIQVDKPQEKKKFQFPLFVSYVDKDKARKRTMYIGFGFVALLLTVAVIGGFRQRDLAKKQSAEFKKSQEVKAKFEEAKAIVGLNSVRSRQLLEEIKDDMQNTPEFKEVYDQALGIKRPQPEQVIDLHLLRDDLSLTQVSLADDGKILGLDSAKGRIVSVDPIKKSGSVVVGNLTSARLLATYPEKILVLTDSGIVQTSNNKVQISKSNDWGLILDMGLYAGNVYLLGADNIYRYQATDAGFGAKRPWTEKGTTLSKQGNMAIDGSIWVLDQGRIAKYVRGVKESFETSEVFGTEAKVFTGEDYKNLYILDKQNGRVVAIDKTGQYQSQYLFDIAKTAIDMAVDEPNGNLFLTEGSKIWVVKL